MELNAEIFAVGTWNGFQFTLKDLNNMASTFSALGDNHRVSLKMGHNDEQNMTDGKPALGWVDKVWVAGDKLMAHFTDLPNIVYTAIQKKLYKNVSIELDFDVQYKGAQYPFVLSGVALLGADIPAVNTLKDLTHYMGRDTAFSVGRRAVFSAIAGQSTEGGKIMELAQLTEQVAKLTAQVSTLTTENAALKAEKLEMGAKVSKFEADAKAVEEATAKARITAKRAEVAAILESGVKSEAITPATREQFTKLMRVDDDVAVMAIDIEEVKKLTANGKKQFGREHGHSGTTAKEDAVDIKVMKAVNEVLAKKEADNFFTAQALVFTRDPELAKAYASFNDAEV